MIVWSEAHLVQHSSADVCESDPRGWRQTQGLHLSHPRQQWKLPRCPIWHASAPGPKKYVVSWINHITSCIELFLTESIEVIVVNTNNLDVKWIYKDIWKEVTQTDTKPYTSHLICTDLEMNLPEVHAESGWTIFWANISLKEFHTLPCVIHFNNCDSRPGRHQQDKLAVRGWRACPSFLTQSKHHS